MATDRSVNLQAELRTWLSEVRDTGPLGSNDMGWRPFRDLATWSRVTASVAALAPPERRPDLYSDDLAVRDDVLLDLSGLGHIAQALAYGQDVDIEQVVVEFAALCGAPLPTSEDWLLLDGEAPAGTQIRIGDYTLRTLSRGDVRHLHRPLHALAGPSSKYSKDLGVLEGAPFLQRVVADRPLVNGYRFPLLGMHTRPELLHWRPLLALLLWNSSDVIRMDSWFIVERGRRADLHAGTVPVVPDMWVEDEGREVEYERRGTGLWEVTTKDVPHLDAFCSAVDALIGTVLSGVSLKNRKAKTRARRLQRASEHLVRAAHRTYGNDFVWEDDTDEVTLHYVIAMEALLADEDQADLSRKVKQRAAALWMSDAHRLKVAEVVGKAYGRRSKYAHGDETGDVDENELDRLRRVAHGVMLRWLITTVPAGLDLPLELDKTLLSDGVRKAIVSDPLQAFFAETPPAVLPSDAQYA
ncbi:hypothetical protein ACFXKW_35890 [Streptomyces sp. NPDC059193]|uniref:hypothetical protein n=1 Tax=Streptomyces sp. NPDC059193 TaxID=3346763 RepID=UPI0036D10C22